MMIRITVGAVCALCDILYFCGGAMWAWIGWSCHVAQTHEARDVAHDRRILVSTSSLFASIYQCVYGASHESECAVHTCWSRDDYYHR